MTRMQKHRKYRRQIERENAEYNRRLAETIFDDWFEHPLEQIERFKESVKHVSEL